MKTKKSKKPLKPAEEYFCVLYASSEEFFGRGEEEPIDLAHTDEAWAKNRRATTVLND